MTTEDDLTHYMTAVSRLRAKVALGDVLARAVDRVYDCLNEFPESSAACAEWVDAMYVAKERYEAQP